MTTVNLPFSVCEALAWRIASQLVRRHPDLTVSRVLLTDGFYDALIVHGPEVELTINRPGSIHVFNSRSPVGKSAWHPRSLGEAIQQDPGGLLADVERVLGLRPGKPRASSTKVLVYRVLSDLAGRYLFRPPIQIWMGHDGESALEWIADFPQVKSLVDDSSERTRRATLERFWHCHAPDLRLVFDLETGDVWNDGGGRLNVAETYGRVDRQLPRLVAAMLELGSTA